MRVGIITAALLLIFFVGGTRAQQRAESKSSPSINVVQLAPTRLPLPDLQESQPDTDRAVQASIPTLSIPTSQPQPQATPSPTSLPIIQEDPLPQTIVRRSKQCQQPGCVVWSQTFLVDHTMNRWQVWEAYIGPGMMPWRQFSAEAMRANPSLWHDGYMFKVGKQYLLPVCVDMESH